MNPRLRSIQTFPLMHQGQPALLLRDPLRITEQALVISHKMGPLLALMDGTRNPDELRAALMIRAGLRLSSTQLRQFIDRLDEALLLHNERFREACDTLLTRYRRGPYREPSSAGASYPSEPDQLAAKLDDLVDKLAQADREPSATSNFEGRGLVSPHIDYERGGAVYAQVWDRGTQAAREAEVAVIFGTDHNGGEGALTLTRQNYATPYGVLPTATDVVDAVAEAIDPELAFAEELHHIHEHSIELAAVWLHHVRERQPIELVPILCGSFFHFISTPYEPATDPILAQALETLTDALRGRPTLVVAAADLAHIGPAFGDPTPVDMVGRARLAADDEALIETICAGDAEAFYQRVAAEEDRRNICGLAPIYLTLRLLGETKGKRTGYERCPADPNGTSWVSVCGILLE